MVGRGVAGAQFDGLAVGCLGLVVAMVERQHLGSAQVGLAELVVQGQRPVGCLLRDFHRLHPVKVAVLRLQ